MTNPSPDRPGDFGSGPRHESNRPVAAGSGGSPEHVKLAYENPTNTKMTQESGGGSGGGMERLAVVEAKLEVVMTDMSGVKAELKTLGQEVAEIRGKVSGLPTYPGLVALLASFIVILATILGFAIRFLPVAS